MSRYIVYGLIDPRTRMIRYVGKSSSGLTRPRSHRRDPKLVPTYRVSRWIHQLQTRGLEFEVVVLDQADTGPPLAELERYWIAFGRASGWPLTNLTDGGEGTPGRKLSKAARAKIAAANAKRVWTDEARRRAGEASAKRSPEGIRRNISAMNSADSVRRRTATFRARHS